MELLEAKICALISLILGTMLVGLLPAWFSTYGRNKWPLFTSSLLCFGGGVLLSTSLVHMLPEIRENLVEYSEYTEILMCTGFFILYFIDEIVHYFYGGTHSHGLAQTNQYHHNSKSNYGATDHSTLLQSRQHAYNPYYGEDGECLFHDDRPASQICHIGHNEPCRNTSVGCFGLIAALSVHAILEGLAVGLESSTTKVLLLFGAIASHKLVVGFCLGVELSSLSESTALRHLVAIAIFSCGTPLGIGLGMSITNIPDNIVELLVPILQCLASGTLLYVSVSEVLPRERARWHQQGGKKLAGVSQFVSVVGGFILMTCLSKYMDH